MKLEGSLDTFPLRELIDMVVYSSVTGVLNVYNHGDQGRLYFRESMLYHVVRGPATGVNALAELLELSRGTFSFVSDKRVEEESLWGTLSHHLQTAERMATRWRQARPYVPHLDLTPSLLLSHEAALRRTGPAHYTVLAAIDGQASLRQISASLGWAEIDVAEAIVQMTVDGLVELRAHAPPPPPPPEAEQPPPTSGGLFDRLLNRGQPAPRPNPEPDPGRPPESRSGEELILKLLRN